MDMNKIEKWWRKQIDDLKKKVAQRDEDNFRLTMKIEKMTGDVKSSYSIEPLIKSAVKKYDPRDSRIVSDMEAARALADSGKWSWEKATVWYVTYFLERGLTPDYRYYAKAAALPDKKKRELIKELRSELGRRLEFEVR